MSFFHNLKDDEYYKQVDDQIAQSFLSDYQSMKELDSKNAAQLHLLLYHLSSTLTHCPRNSRIPPLAVLKIILTLVARLPMLNNLTGSHSLLSGNLGDTYSTQGIASAQSLRDLAHLLMRSYIEGLEEYGRIEDYEQLLLLFQSFIVEPKMFGLIPKLTTKTPQSRAVPTRNRTVTRLSLQTPEVSEVSDSEMEFSKLEAVVKDQLSASPQHSNNPLMETLFNDSRPPSRRERTPPIPQKDDTLFGDSLITEKLKPTTKNTYCMWSLLRWAFYCANYATEHGLFKTSVYFSIYESHRDFALLVFRFIRVDFKRFLAELKSSEAFDNGASEKARSSVAQRVSKDTLLGKLIAQSAALKNAWYDRILEQTFSGLDTYVTSRPPACFSSEASLTLRDREKGMKMKHNCNVDSLDLRIDIVFQVYLYSLFHSNTGYVDEYVDRESQSEDQMSNLEDPLSSVNFIQQLARRLLEIEPIYFEEFLLASLLRLGSQHDMHMAWLLIETASSVLFEFTDDIEVECMRTAVLQSVLGSDVGGQLEIVGILLKFLSEILESILPDAGKPKLRGVNFMVYWWFNFALVYRQKDISTANTVEQNEATESIQRRMEQLWNDSNELSIPWNITSIIW